MTVKELTSAPSLLPLYAKAALTGPLHRGGDSLPDSAYSLAEQTIDADHLRAYDKVCGFGLTDVLPPTYLHMLAFPLSVALMTEREFPFPLVGAVHVANSITVHRPVTLDETVSILVRADDLRPHAAGQQFDLVAEVRVADELVWSSRSTYLRRGKPTGEKKSGARPEPEPLTGAVSLVRVPADIGRRYAAVSGDRNPIHLHALTAKAFGFPSAIAHGMWVKARTLAALEGRLPSTYTVDVAFKLPVLLPTTLGIEATAEGLGWALDVRNPKSGKPHMAGTVTTTEQAPEPTTEPSADDTAKATAARKAAAKAAPSKAAAKSTKPRPAPKR